MLRKKSIIQILLFVLLGLCAVNSVAAQKTPVDKSSLAVFEKSIEQGNYAEIERDLLNYVIANQNDAKGFELLARLRSAQKRQNEAKSLYQKALMLQPGLTSAKIELAVINFETENAEQARLALNEISDKDISNDAIRISLAQALALVGDCQKTLQTVEKLNVKTKNSDALPIRAECYLKSSENEKVNSLIPLAKNIVKENQAVSIKFAEVLADHEMYKESADVLRSVVLSAPQNVDALILLAKSEIFIKDLANAEIHLNRAAKINSNSPNLLFVQAILESEQGNHLKALELLEKSLAFDPNSTETLSRSVITAMRANQAGKAVKASERLLQIKPDESEFLYLYGAASLQNNNLQSAENSLIRYVELRPNDSRGCLALGLTFAAQPEKLDAARKQLQKCVEINPKNFEAKYQLGLSFKTQGETAKAIEYLEATVKDSPNYAAALRDLGAVYLQSGAENKARIVLEKSVAISPNDADTHFQLSRLYNLIGETELAKKHLEMFQNLRNPKQGGM